MDAGSTRPKLPGVTEIFSEYVRQRQNGKTQQEAVGYLRPLMERLRKEARQQLIALLRSWEAREGVKYQSARAMPISDESLVAPPQPGEDLSWLPAKETTTKPIPNVVPGPPSLNPDTQVHPAVSNQYGTQSQRHEPSSSLPASPSALQTFYCPNCGKANRLGDAYCFSCGSLLNVGNVQTRSLERGDSELLQVGQTHFSPSSTLLLYVRGYEEPIRVQMPENGSVTLGRTSSNSMQSPEVDLSAFQAGEYGVSRAHARLRYQDSTITVTDLGSVNHTFINGQHLHANEVRVLRDGDEIRLGRLIMRVAYKHAVRGLR